MRRVAGFLLLLAAQASLEAPIEPSTYGVVEIQHLDRRGFNFNCKENARRVQARCGCVGDLGGTLHSIRPCHPDDKEFAKMSLLQSASDKKGVTALLSQVADRHLAEHRGHLSTLQADLAKAQPGSSDHTALQQRIQRHEKRVAFWVEQKGLVGRVL